MFNPISENEGKKSILGVFFFFLPDSSVMCSFSDVKVQLVNFIVEKFFVALLYL